MLMKHNLFKGVLLTMTLVILYSCTSESPSNTDNVQQTRVQQIKDDQAVQLGEELYNSFSYKLTRSQEENTPDYFGGSYSDSQDNLIVLIKGMDKEGIKEAHPTFRVMRQSCSAYSLSLKYLSSLKPYALRFITFILLFIPSTLAVEI